MGQCNTAILATASVAFALSLGLARTADAEIFTAIYTGTVSNGYDQTGVFGAPNTDLTGDAFTAVYTINDAIGVLENYPGYVSYLYGGTYFEAASPVSAAISINGRTARVGGDYYGASYRNTIPYNAESVVEDFARDYTDNGVGTAINNYVISYVYSLSSFVNNSDPRGFLSYNVEAGDQTSGSASFYTEANGIGMENAGADLDITHVTIGAPEPGAWALMLLGVGAIGLGARRRRTALA